MDLLSAEFFSALLAIVVIDLVLAGDNAIVIALAARRLPPALQRKAVLWGSVGAVVVRSVMTLAVVWLPVIAGGESLRTVYDRTIAFQFGRDAPFSVWGLYGWSLAQHAWQLLTVAFIVAAPFLPRRRDVVGLAAVCAAILLAVLLSVTYWFYLYLVWMFPALIVALLARHEAPLRRHATRVVSAAGAPESAAAGSLWPPGEHRS